VHVAGTQSAAFRNRFAANDPMQRQIVAPGPRIDRRNSGGWLRRSMQPYPMEASRAPAFPMQDADPPVRIALAGPQTASLSANPVRNLTTADRTINFPHCKRKTWCSHDKLNSR